jgi:hypothetical protein
LCGAGEKSRTPDLRITNALLYQLSYTGMIAHGSAASEARILAQARAPTAGAPADYASSNGASFFSTATFFKVT